MAQQQAGFNNSAWKHTCRQQRENRTNILCDNNLGAEEWYFFDILCIPYCCRCPIRFNFKRWKNPHTGIKLAVTTISKHPPYGICTPCVCVCVCLKSFSALHISCAVFQTTTRFKLYKVRIKHMKMENQQTEESKNGYTGMYT